MKTQLLRTPETPCYVIDEAALTCSLRSFATAMSELFPHSVAALSVKTNPLPHLLTRACEMGYLAEVVSADEYELALRCGFAKNRIVYNGPLKSRDTFLDAIEHGALVNLETFREVGWLASLDHRRVHPVGVRLNVNVSAISPDDQNHDEDVSRFGFSAESGELDAVLAAIGEMPHVRFERLHLHRNSRTRSRRFYERLLDYALGLMQARGITLRQIDVGGGFHSMLPAHPTHRQYAETLARVVTRYQPIDTLTLITEPGNAVVNTSFTFVTQVIDVKHHDGACFVTVDGSRIDVDPLFRRNDHTMRIVSSGGTAPVVERQIVGGCTCLEFDRLMELRHQPALRPGDRLALSHAGAYTLTLTPLFTRHWPAVYSYYNGQLTRVSNRY